MAAAASGRADQALARTDADAVVGSVRGGGQRHHSASDKARQSPCVASVNPQLDRCRGVRIGSYQSEKLSIYQ